MSGARRHLALTQTLLWTLLAVYCSLGIHSSHLSAGISPINEGRRDRHLATASDPASAWSSVNTTTLGGRSGSSVIYVDSNFVVIGGMLSRNITVFGPVPPTSQQIAAYMMEKINGMTTGTSVNTYVANGGTNVGCGSCSLGKTL